MEIEVAGKGLRRLQKGTKGASSSVAKAGPAILFGAHVVEPHGLTWFNTQKVAKYSPENWINKGYLALEFPAIRDKVPNLKRRSMKLSKKNKIRVETSAPPEDTGETLVDRRHPLE
ncbi:hypothetical protein HAX54_000367 [Datura stramonium]|uniref:Uncharacterized protein n=1 Tax=Datura stramonium TaxID=4076 RepID=A0ABS8WTV6_DATST|nr:hypothetical protein [Datura stramonium]